MNYIDIKVTVWNRLKFADDADMQKVIETLKVMGVDLVIDDDLGFQESETMYDTEERLEPTDNGNQPTTEVYQNDKLIWENSVPETLPKT